MQINLQITNKTYKECKKHAEKSGVDLETFLAGILEQSFQPVPKVTGKKLQELQAVMDRISNTFVRIGSSLAQQGRFLEARLIFEELEKELSKHLEMV
ncbi:hypothetical protein [Helicobacter bizzozeronii]|uniref:hypothetical protein n=1 Tax=Helicobacter bizzozeronii TaxID=56877 RepID=UPI000CEE2429|nr:hypothetical protein [Helicobacter bizzozeronii]